MSEIPEFRPCVAYYEDGDYSQMLLEDCATVTGWPPVVVEPLYRMSAQDGSLEIVGFQWAGKLPDTLTDEAKARSQALDELGALDGEELA